MIFLNICIKKPTHIKYTCRSFADAKANTGEYKKIQNHKRSDADLPVQKVVPLENYIPNLDYTSASAFSVMFSEFISTAHFINGMRSSTNVPLQMRKDTNSSTARFNIVDCLLIALNALDIFRLLACAFGRAMFSSPDWRCEPRGISCHL